MPNSNGAIDPIGTILYMLCCLQEMNENKALDRFGRFPYEKSYQFEFGNIEDNLVQEQFDSLLRTHGIDIKKKRSKRRTWKLFFEQSMLASILLRIKKLEQRKHSEKV